MLQAALSQCHFDCNMLCRCAHIHPRLLGSNSATSLMKYNLARLSPSYTVQWTRRLIKQLSGLLAITPVFITRIGLLITITV
jgi:hypothetical protein